MQLMEDEEISNLDLYSDSSLAFCLRSQIPSVWSQSIFLDVGGQPTYNLIGPVSFKNLACLKRFYFPIKNIREQLRVKWSLYTWVFFLLSLLWGRQGGGVAAIFPSTCRPFSTSINDVFSHGHAYGTLGSRMYPKAQLLHWHLSLTSSFCICK